MQIPVKQYWNLLVKYLQPQWRRVALMAVLLLSSIGLQLLVPQILRYFIDAAMSGDNSQKLTVAAGLFIVVALLNQVLAVAAVYMGEWVGWTATNALRADLALHCLRMDLSFHKNRTPGELIERIDGDVTAIANFFAQFVVRVLGNLILVLGVLVLLAREDWRLGLAFTAFVAVTLLALISVQRLGVTHWESARQASAEFSGFLLEQLAGTEDIRSSGASPYVMRRFYEFMRQRLQKEQKAGLMSSLMVLIVISMFTIGTAGALALSSYLFTASLVTIGTVYLIVQYTEVLYRPLRLITMQMQDLQKASASIERIQALSSTTSKLLENERLTLPDGPLMVEFHAVSFGYAATEDEKPKIQEPEANPYASPLPGQMTEFVLDGVSFTLQAGKVLGVLGRTGSGKTTLTRLLFRLYDPNGGIVRLGDVDIRATRLADVRQRVGMVTQDVQLFRATVRDNLTLFDERVSDEKILEALQELGLWAWYRALPQGLDTELEAGNGGLSAGEAQLLAFTRVFLKDPGLVILDEASSRLDPATEQLIEQAISKLMHNRTGIIIAHRLATLHRADEILILEKGRVHEHGTRRSLVTTPSSRFYRLLQTGLEEALA